MRQVAVLAAPATGLHQLAMADAGKSEPHQYLAALRRWYLDVVLDGKRRVKRPQYGGLHFQFLPWYWRGAFTST
jgi:hypothetical protein